MDQHPSNAPSRSGLVSVLEPNTKKCDTAACYMSRAHGAGPGPSLRYQTIDPERDLFSLGPSGSILWGREKM